MTSGRGAVQTYVSQRGCAIRQLHPVCSMSQTIWLRDWIVACRRTLIISCGSHSCNYLVAQPKIACGRVAVLLKALLHLMEFNRNCSYMPRTMSVIKIVLVRNLSSNLYCYKRTDGHETNTWYEVLTAAKLNKIFSGFQLCQLMKFHGLSDVTADSDDLADRPRIFYVTDRLFSITWKG
jgi:hypothetical protein